MTKLEFNPWLSLQGYKEFTVHMSSFHGGLDMVMAMDAREEVRFDNIWIDMIHSFIGCVYVNLFGTTFVYWMPSITGWAVSITVVIKI